MRMRAGATLSGLGHAALIALVVMGLPWFSRRDSEPVQVTEVSFVSEADFRRAQAAAEAPRVDTAPPVQPAARPAPPKPAPTPAPAPAAPPTPAPEPEAVTLAPDFNPDAPLSGPATAPALPAPTLAEPARPAAVAPLAAVAPPLARPAPTIAPTPTPPPPVTARPADEATPEPAPAPHTEPPREPRPQTAPPEAAPEPAAPEVQPDLALATQAPPKARPAQQPAQKPAPQTADTQPDKPSPQEAAVLQALKQEVSRRQDAATPPTPPTPPSVTAATPAAGTDGDRPETSLPSGPPITNAEKDGLRLAVQRCWVVPAGLRDASELRVTLAAELTPDGAVVASSIKLVDPSPAPDPRFQQAYEAGRRASLRCAPYVDLPRDKFAQWRNIEVVFDPKGMVSW